MYLLVVVVVARSRIVLGPNKKIYVRCCYKVIFSYLVSLNAFIASEGAYSLVEGAEEVT